MARSPRIAALDGIRAVAVFAVILFHTNVPGFAAGFVGVDVFFVLSGFLITGLLLDDVERSGSVHLGGFWARRVRRLFPALFVLLVVTIAWGALFSPPHVRDGLRTDIASALLYVANWRFIETSTYFASRADRPVLEHLWSLAVEEQFYVLWPALVAGLALLLRSRSAAVRRGVIAGVSLALAALSAGALAWLYAHEASQERAYMGTDARVFEPLLGAALSCFVRAPRAAQRISAAARPLTVLGMTGICAAIFLLGSRGEATFPAYYHGGAVALSLATCALLAWCALGSQRHLLVRLLASRPMAWLGRISYGIYLWHWPLTCWLIHEGGGFQPARATLVALLSTLFAALSYYGVELPVREGRISVWFSGRRLALSLPATLVTALLASYAWVRPPELRGARVLLIGDSVPARLYPALSQLGLAREIAVFNGAHGACPAMPISITKPDGTLFFDGHDCEQKVSAQQAELLRELHPDIIVWWSRYELADRRSAAGVTLHAGTPAFWQAQRADLEAALARLTASGATVVIVHTDRPGLGLSARCGDDCHFFYRRLLEQDELRVAWNALVDSVAAREKQVRTVTMDDLYCRDAATPCNDRLPDGTLARPDGSHFAPEIAPLIASALLERVIAAVNEAKHASAR